MKLIYLNKKLIRSDISTDADRIKHQEELYTNFINKTNKIKAPHENHATKARSINYITNIPEKKSYVSHSTHVKNHYFTFSPEKTPNTI